MRPDASCRVPSGAGGEGGGGVGTVLVAFAATCSGVGSVCDPVVRPCPCDGTWKYLSSDEGHLVDALAPRGDEGRGTLRKASGSCEQALIRGCPNGETQPLQGDPPLVRKSVVWGKSV